MFTANANPMSGGFDVMQFLPILVIFVIFYFLILRPQQKKTKTHQEMLGALRKGDRVVTSGGLIGIIDKIINEQEVLLEISEGVKVRLLRQTITDNMAKTMPITHQDDKKEDTKIEKKSNNTQKSKPKKITKK